MPSWPSVEEQFAKAKVISGNALDKLIRDNQDFHLLRPEEADDNIGLPPWLRVYWRKQHPEGVYSADDPTGGYPRVLKNIHTWMLANQNLQPSPPPGPGPTAAREALAPRAAVGTNQRISGGHANPRSESDIRVSYNAQTRSSLPPTRSATQIRHNSTLPTAGRVGVRQRCRSSQVTSSTVTRALIGPRMGQRGP
jgi:hypothetical protein